LKCIGNKYNINFKEGIQFPGDIDEDYLQVWKRNEIVEGHAKVQPFET